MSIISKNLYFLRKKADLSQTEFGKLFSASRGMINSYETDLATPSYERVKMIADHFKISMDDLSGRDLTKAVETPLETGNHSNVVAMKDALIEQLKNQIADLKQTIEMQKGIINKLMK